MKTILITGATAGIGRHAALELVRLGHRVIATGRREGALAELAEEASVCASVQGELRGAQRARRIGGGTLHGIRLDVTNEADVKRVAAEIDALTDGHGVDVLVNNAGYGQMGPLETVTDAELRKQYDTNVFGLMNVTRAFVPKMRERGEGRVINVGSIGGRVTFPLMGAYNSTKYAVESLSDALRNELAPFGVKVSIVEPGPIRTEFNERAMETIDRSAVDGTPYAPIVARADAIRARFDERAAGPAVTTRAIVHAALAKRPRIRYVVPFSSAVMLSVLAFLPTRLVDALMRAIAGLSRKKLAPAALPPAPPSDREAAAA
jgi:NAD(P)-dependent dehydrogenase (short-subunit alcohol dehydrogenase family)